MSLLDDLERLRPELAAAAQTVVDDWVLDEDDDYGGGGVCDDVAQALSGVISSLPGVEVVDGGHDGDDHAWVVVYDDTEAFAVDVPPGVYETGGGYAWKKIEGAKVSPDDIVIEPVLRSDVVLAAMAERVAGLPR
jgi:hypothetical protein